MLETKISGLKARLSAYLAAVRTGQTVIVHDRNRPIARLVPYDDVADGLVIDGPSFRGGDISKPKAVRLRKRVDTVARLREDRDLR